MKEEKLRYKVELVGADFSGANLEGVDLSGANLDGANFSKANLRDANFSGASLVGANFFMANLACANLAGANLEGANFQGADIECANLRGAKYSPLAILSQVNWGDPGNELIIELMKWDAFCSVNIKSKAFQAWAEGGDCPFGKEVRAFRFQERRDVWEPGPPTMTLAELFARLCEEMRIKI